MRNFAVAIRSFDVMHVLTPISSCSFSRRFQFCARDHVFVSLLKWHPTFLIFTCCNLLSTFTAFSLKQNSRERAQVDSPLIKDIRLIKLAKYFFLRFLDF